MSSRPTATVTVIIPHHATTAEFLPEAIRSVVAQTRQADAIIVVNDVDSRGPAWARNVAARQARTDWLLLLDADDTLDPEFISAGMRVVESDGSMVDIVVPSDARLSAAILKDNYLPYCCLVRRYTWQVDLRGHQEPSVRGLGLCDWDFWIRVWRAHVQDPDAPVLTLGYIPASLFKHRDRPDSMSKWSNEHFSAMRDDLRRAHGITREDLE